LEADRTDRLRARVRAKCECELERAGGQNWKLIPSASWLQSGEQAARLLAGIPLIIGLCRKRLWRQAEVGSLLWRSHARHGTPSRRPILIALRRPPVAAGGRSCFALPSAPKQAGEQCARLPFGQRASSAQLASAQFKPDRTKLGIRFKLRKCAARPTGSLCNGRSERVSALLANCVAGHFLWPRPPLGQKWLRRQDGRCHWVEICVVCLSGRRIVAQQCHH